MTTLLVVQGSSRSQSKSGITECVRRIERYGWETTLISLSEYLDNTSSTADFHSIAAVGGDGTVAAVIGQAENTPVLVVPDGTGNDFARMIGIRSLSHSIQVFREGVVTKCDIGKISHGEKSEYFVNGTGFGLDGVIAEKHENGIPYSISVATALFKLPIFSARICSDDLEIGEVTGDMKFVSLVIANGQYFGGGFRMAPEANIDDGIFDVVLVKPVSSIKYAYSIIKVRRGTHLTDPSVKFWKCSKLEILSDEEIPFHIDGEFRSSNHITIELLPLARKIYVANSVN
ncbi:MAG: hypothetical protein JKX97_01925 [Candidatus Lindowbacteria bacterium]|nr:hypothetical protein [Candidatus Lindowbacteria bacterium]